MRNLQQNKKHTGGTAQAFLLTISTVALLLPTMPSHAGFSTVNVVKPVPSVTAGETAGEWAAKTVSAPMAGTSIAFETRGALPAQEPVVIQGSPMPPAAAGIVEGFADQVPLTIALQEVLPQGFGYALGDGVNPGQFVSWRGGRPWQTVLTEMLGPAGLAYQIHDRLVTVSNPHAAPMVVSGAPPVAPLAAPPVAQNYVPAPPPSQPLFIQDTGAVPPYQPGMAMAAQPYPPMMMQPHAMPPQASFMGAHPLQIETPPLFRAQTWEARPGQTLRTTLQEWCARTGTELNWQAEFDYPVMASMNMTGSFEDAVRTLLSGFNTAKPIPYGRLHYNPAAGQSTLVVEASGNHYGD